MRHQGALAIPQVLATSDGTKNLYGLERIGVDPNSMLSVAITVPEHQRFTNEWLRQIGRRNMNTAVATLTATTDDVWQAAQAVYEDYPALLEVARKALGR